MQASYSSFCTGRRVADKREMTYSWEVCFSSWEYAKHCNRIGYRPREDAYKFGEDTGFYTTLLEDFKLNQFFTPEDIELFQFERKLEMEYTTQQRALAVMTPFRLAEEYPQIVLRMMEFISQGHDPLDSFMIAQATFNLNGAHTVYSMHAGIRTDYRSYLDKINSRATKKTPLGEVPLSVNSIWSGTGKELLNSMYGAPGKQIQAAFARLKEHRA